MVYNALSNTLRQVIYLSIIHFFQTTWVLTLLSLSITLTGCLTALNDQACTCLTEEEKVTSRSVKVLTLNLVGNFY